MEKKGRAVKDKRYEDKHKAERKAKCIAIDGCTAFSGKVNCIVLEDENI